MTILVISHAGDDHARAVLAELERMGAHAVLFDLAAFPREVSLSLSYGSRQGRGFTVRMPPDRVVDLADCNAIWWRRPRPFEIDPQIVNPPERAFAYNECYEAVSGLWDALDAFWVNKPRFDDAAAKKSYHLQIASEVGLRIPRTLITNDVGDAQAFVDSVGLDRAVYKSFSATETHWRETRLLLPGEQALLEQVRLAPVIFQEYVPAEVDLRVTIVGDRQFAAAISTPEGGYRYDYRIDLATARMEATTLPRSVEAALARLMQRLGLVYGAVDMRRTADGHHIFLEVNPAGLWLFVEEQTGQPITKALAALLMQRDGESTR